MFKDVVNFLARHCADSEARHTIIDPAFDAHPILYKQIDFSGDAQAFASRLVRTLRRYGELEPGVQALWHLLLTLREQVGLDHQQKIDSFEPWANTAHIESEHTSTPLAVPETVDEERRLDAAMPRETVVNQPTEIWVQICLPQSRGFRDKLPHITEDGDIIDQRDVRENCLAIPFLLDEVTGQAKPLSVSIEIEALDFHVPRPSQTVSVRHKADSPHVIFLAKPLAAHKRSIVHINLKLNLPGGSFISLGAIALYTTTKPEGYISETWSLRSVTMKETDLKQIIQIYGDVNAGNVNIGGTQNTHDISTPETLLIGKPNPPTYNGGPILRTRFFGGIMALLVCGFVMLPILYSSMDYREANLQSTSVAISGLTREAIDIYLTMVADAIQTGEAAKTQALVSQTTPSDTPIPTMTTLTPTPVPPTFMPTITPISPTPDMTATAITLEQEITRLIHAEAWAVVNEDETEIAQIFASNITIIDRTNNETYRDPAALYEPKFETYKFCSISHYGIRINMLSDDIASATSGSYGDYDFNRAVKCTWHFDNPPGSDIWRFQRVNGEWKIVYFSFK